MVDLWHYAIGSERKGPVSDGTLGKLLASGEISAETYVWQPGMDNWAHLGEVAALKPLVAGIGADAAPEAFVEEDTAFTPGAEILAGHAEATVVGDAIEPTAGVEPDFTDLVAEPAMAVVVDAQPHPMAASPLGTDTVVEDVADALAQPAAEMARDIANEPDAGDLSNDPTLLGDDAPLESDLFSAPEADLFGSDAAEDPFASSSGEPDDLFAAPASGAEDLFGAASSESDDIFGAAHAGADDIFGAVSADDAGDAVDGVHGRHQSSVLFSLDELGREAAPSTHDDPFVTDTSGLIDIKAVAASQREAGAGDPFGATNLVIPPRTGVGTVSVPLVTRRRNLGPWIMAAAVLLLIGGGVITYLFMNQDKGPVAVPETTIASGDKAAAGSEKAVAGSEKAVAGSEKAVAGSDKAAAGSDKAAAGSDKAAAGSDTAAASAASATKPAGEVAVAAGDPAATGDAKAVAQAGAAGAAGDVAAAQAAGDSASADKGASGDAAAAAKPAAAAGSAATAEVAKPVAPVKTAAASKTTPVRRTTRRTTKRRTKPPTPVVTPPPSKPAAAVVEAAPKPKSPSGNTAKVNALLDKLNKGGGSSTATAGATDSSLPKKLSAISVRNTVKKNRSKFARCGSMTGSASSVTVSTSFVIQSSGVVKSARVVNGGGTSAEVQRCVVGALKQTRFGKFRDPNMTVNYPIRLL